MPAVRSFSNCWKSFSRLELCTVLNIESPIDHFAHQSFTVVKTEIIKVCRQLNKYLTISNTTSDGNGNLKRLRNTPNPNKRNNNRNAKRTKKNEKNNSVNDNVNGAFVWANTPEKRSEAMSQGRCFDCGEKGHRVGDPQCKNKAKRDELNKKNSARTANSKTESNVTKQIKQLNNKHNKELTKIAKTHDKTLKDIFAQIKANAPSASASASEPSVPAATAGQ